MKIKSYELKKVLLNFKNPIKVTFGELRNVETIILRLETDDGIVGYGEASPFGFITGDTVETSLIIGKLIGDRLIGEDAFYIEHIHNIMDSLVNYNGAIKAAFDIALYDIAAKKLQIPLYKYLGGYKDTIDCDLTVGIDSPDEMARISAEYVKQGFKTLKIKLGTEPKLDIERFAKIREAVGEDIVLRIDANQGWNVNETINIMNKLEKYNVEFIEQPIVWWDKEGSKEIKFRISVPIVADESCHIPQDAFDLAKNRMVDGINIKLMKCGGIYKANIINAISEVNNIFCMVGCMAESRIANLAGMHFVAAHKNVKHADLDTVFNISCDWMTGGFTNQGGSIKLTDEPGLGVHVEGF